jgi:adenylosuccinate synthase
MKICIYGGHYGSEGKGSASEFFIHRESGVGRWIRTSPILIVAGENSPNSGHTCSAGKTRNLPAGAYFADAVLLGPDSVIDMDVLLQDIDSIDQWRADHASDKPRIQVFIHEHAALLGPQDGQSEIGVVKAISSTGSGSGAARVAKCFDRDPQRVIKYAVKDLAMAATLANYRIVLLNHSQYLSFVDQHAYSDWVFECSQGTLLDVNWGIFPYVTSRTTLPRVAVERNGLGSLDFDYVGVYRTFPIRTGGPSGPTGGAEITFEDIGVVDEIATVTKRIRRVFQFSLDDFELSLRLTRPQVVCFTHLDYLTQDDFRETFQSFLSRMDLMPLLNAHQVSGLFFSHETGKFYQS